MDGRPLEQRTIDASLKMKTGISVHTSAACEISSLKEKPKPFWPAQLDRSKILNMNKLR